MQDRWLINSPERRILITVQSRGNGALNSNIYFRNEKKKTNAKLTKVSKSVIPVWSRMEPSFSIEIKQVTILEGLLKTKESMIPASAVNSQRSKKRIQILLLPIRTVRRCFFWERIYCFWAMDNSLIMV